MEHSRAQKRGWFQRTYVRKPRKLLSAEEKRRRHRAKERRLLKTTAKGRVRLLIGRARIRARKSKIPFNLKAEHLNVPTRCPVLGIPLSFAPGTPLSNRPSIDRVVPAKGYVAGNAEIISFRANTLKNNATIDEIRAILAYMEAHELYA